MTNEVNMLINTVFFFIVMNICGKSRHYFGKMFQIWIIGIKFASLLELFEIIVLVIFVLNPMKKYLILALSIIALAVSSCSKPDPENMQFLGNYSGKLVSRTTITFYTEHESDVSDMNLTMNLVVGAQDNQVVANCVAYGQNFSMTGIVSENKIVFDPATIDVALTDFISINLPIINTLDASANITFNYSATLMHDNLLNVDYLYLDGTTNGNITAQALGIPVTFPLNGTSVGRVNKVG